MKSSFAFGTQEKFTYTEESKRSYLLGRQAASTRRKADKGQGVCFVG